MTKENLLKYLRDPIYLQQITYQELKTLVAENPSSLSLRYLLAIKSKQENNSDFERQLAYLATYGSDRSHLFDVFNKKELTEKIEEVLPQEDYLELKELSALERELKERPISRSNDLLFEMEAPTTTISNYNASEMLAKKEVVSIEDEDYYILNFDEELDSSTPVEQVGQDISEAKVEGNLAAIEDLFKDLEDDEVSIPATTELITNGISRELDLQETVEGGEFPDIPLEVLDTNMELISNKSINSSVYIEADRQANSSIPDMELSKDVASQTTNSIDNSSVSIEMGRQAGKSIEDMELSKDAASQATASIAQEEQLEVAKKREDISEIVPEIIPETTEETLVVNPIPKSSFSTWYNHDGKISSFSGFDLVGFNSKGIIKELTASEKELQIAEQIREEKLRLAKLQAARRAESIKETDSAPAMSVIQPSKKETPIPEKVQSEISPATQKEVPKKKKKKQKHILKKIKKEAETSVVFEEDIASETLAQLLVLQGHYSKARAMYEHLSLIFPEKSGLFAYEIQKIENLEDEVA